MSTGSYSSCDQTLLINELTCGIELANQLRAQMGPQYPVETKEILLQQILSSYEKALFILGWDGPHQHVAVPPPGVSSSPIPAMESPQQDNLQMGFNAHDDSKGCSKKRKAALAWAEQVRISPRPSLEGPPPDGYSWRKYGQKDILRAKHPRSYYRCTYRNVQDCWATKQVQRSDDDPTVLQIIYKGKHTCNVAHQSNSAPTSPENQEPRPYDNPTMECHQDSSVVSFHEATEANTQSTLCFPFSSTSLDYLNNESSMPPPNSIYGDFSPSIPSPSTSGSNYFSVSPCNMLDSFASIEYQKQNSETGIAQMLPAATSATNSPAIDPDFSSLGTWSFSPAFDFNNL